MNDFLSSLSLDPSALVAGALGGVVAIFALRQTKPFDAVGSVLVGAILGNYLWGLTFKWLAWVPVTPPLAQALTGMGGMGFAQAIITLMKNAPAMLQQRKDTNNEP